MSLLHHNPKIWVWLFIEDDDLPYSTPDNVICVNASGQTIFPHNGPNSRSPFTYLAMIRSAYPLIFTGKENGLGIVPVPKLNRIISMDCDVIVCDSLQPIWDIDMTNKWFAAVPQWRSDDRPYGRNHIYRNAGVTVLNLEQMRKDKMAEKAIELLNKNRYAFIDEQVMNLLNMAEGDSKCVDLPPRYNEHMEVTQSLHPAVVHYAGEKMVWQQNPEHVYRGSYLLEWMKYAKEEECKAAEIVF